MSKTRTPDILRKSHRHVDRKERARIKDELRHEVKEFEDEEPDEGPAPPEPADDQP